MRAGVRAFVLTASVAVAILAAAVLPEAALAATCNGLTATIVGTDAAQTINGTAGNDVIAALGGNDTVNGLGGSDTICGGLGNDVITGGLGNDRFDGEGGTDTGSFGPSLTAVNANLTTGAATGEGTDTLVALENLTGSKLNDVLTGSALVNTIVPGLGNDTADGAGGVDTVSYAASATAVVANLTAGTATGQGTDTLSNFENVIGSSLNDTLTGNAVANNLNGGTRRRRHRRRSRE